MPQRPPRHQPPGQMTQRERSAENDTRRGTSTQRGYDWNWRKLRKMVLARNPMCQQQGCLLPATDVDHIIPIRKGGDNSSDNLQALCHACHSRKTALEDGGFGH